MVESDRWPMPTSTVHDHWFFTRAELSYTGRTHSNLTPCRTQPAAKPRSRSPGNRRRAVQPRSVKDSSGRGRQFRRHRPAWSPVQTSLPGSTWQSADV